MFELVGFQARVQPHFKVWAASDTGMRQYAVKNPAEAIRLIGDLAKALLEDANITWDAFGLEELESDGEYHEWYDDDGNSINDLLDQKEEA